MLASAKTVDVVAEVLAQHRIPSVVIDPVRTAHDRILFILVSFVAGDGLY